jgi:hypothetical protein
MNSAERKIERELAVFESFVLRAGLNVQTGSVRHGEELKNEPDILCRVEPDGEVAFELTEACAPEFAEAETRAAKTEDGVEFAWGNDVSEQTIREKLQKTYVAGVPIDLLLYTNGRTALPDDAIRGMIEPLLRNGLGPFRRIWFMGDEISEISGMSSREHREQSPAPPQAAICIFNLRGTSGHG